MYDILIVVVPPGSSVLTEHSKLKLVRTFLLSESDGSLLVSK